MNETNQLSVIGLLHWTKYRGRTTSQVIKLNRIVKDEGVTALGIEGRSKIDRKSEEPGKRLKAAIALRLQRIAGKAPVRLVALEDSPADAAIHSLHQMAFDSLKEEASVESVMERWLRIAQKARREAHDNPELPENQILVGLVRKVTPFIRHNPEGGLTRLIHGLSALRSTTLYENARQLGLSHIAVGQIHAIDMEGKPDTRVTFLEEPTAPLQRFRASALASQLVYYQISGFINQLRDYARNHPANKPGWKPYGVV